MILIEPLFELSAKYIKKAIRNETNAIDKFERRTFSKKEGINIFILPPSKTIGIVPIKMDLNNLSDSFLIGFFQAFAIIPGVSRSGVTISSALISGWERGDAAKFSFLLGMPAISLAAIVEFISSFNDFFSLGFFPLLVGLITTFLSSLLAIDFLLKYFSSNGLKIFIMYRVIFGVVILLNL